jgi:hypothetical protein
MSINREVFARVWFVSKFGYPDHRNAALARLSMLREALRTDRRFRRSSPSSPPWRRSAGPGGTR